MADRPPEHVYVVCVRTEWPISVVSGEPWVHAADAVEDVVNRRMRSANVLDRSDIKIFKARLTDIEEVDLLPTSTIPAALRERVSDDASQQAAANDGAT